MTNNFVKATSENLPKVDMFAVNNYIRTNDCFNELKWEVVKYKGKFSLVRYIVLSIKKFK